MPQLMQRSFTSGEIAPSLHSRADITKYATGLALCENFFVRAQGGVYTRPGFKFIGELDDHTRKGRLIPFSFNTEQTYILVFEHLKIRILKDGGFILDGVSLPVNDRVTTPYGCHVSSNGLYLYITDYTVGKVIQYTMSSAWDLNTATYTQELSISADSSRPFGLTFKPDGTKMYISNKNNPVKKRVSEYTLSTAWDLSTATYTSSVGDGSSTDIPYDVEFSASGTTMNVYTGRDGSEIDVYTLSTAWDVTTASFTSNETVDVSNTVHFGDSGNVMYLTGFDASVTQYDLSTPYDISTATLNDTASFSTECSNIHGMSIDSTGMVLHVMDFTTGTVYQYDMSTAWDVTTASYAASSSFYEITTPYTEDELPRIGFTQSADVLTIVHPNHDVANLSRLSETSWTLADIDYAPTTTAPGVLTLTAVGAGAGTHSKDYRYVVTAVGEDGSESLPSPANLINTPSLSVTAGVKISWTSVTGAESYRVYKEPTSGAVSTEIFGWIGDTEANEFIDFNIAPITSDAPPSDRQPFSGINNNPSAVNYYQQRQVFANTNNEPQAVYTTQVGNFDSLRVSNPARDDDAVTFAIAAQQVNEIRHILSLDSLILLTSGGEWIATEGQDRVLTPSTIGVRIQSYNGSSWVRPVVINSTALYLQEKGARIRDLGYEFSSDKYTGNDLSVMSEHLFEGYQITEMAYSDEPYGILWCVRDDGRLLGLTYLREHEVWGWHQHVTDGSFESVATINEDGRDAVYVIVNRTIGGQTKRYVERLEPRESTAAEDCFYVDSGLTYDGAPATVISGLDHLEGEGVTILADGYEVTGKTVSSGSITLDRAASKVHIGLGYTPVIETLDIDTPSTTQTVKAQSVSVSKVFIEVEQSRGGFVGAKLDATNPSTIQMTEIKPRFQLDGYDPIALRTFKQEVIIQPDWHKGGGLRIEQRAPLPMAILSVIPQVDIGGN